MRHCISSLAVFVTVLAITTVASAGERSVVVPTDNVPFTITEQDYVRLTGTGIAGSEITVKVTGLAQVVSENVITKRKNGKVPVGVTKKEFEIKPTGKGKVKVTITVTSPIPNKKPTTTDYEFTVK